MVTDRRRLKVGLLTTREKPQLALSMARDACVELASGGKRIFVLAAAVALALAQPAAADEVVRDALRAARVPIPAVPIMVIGRLDGFTAAVRAQVLAANTCAFVLFPARDTIYVRSACDDDRGARAGHQLSQLRLAALIVHEVAHLEGADEAGALRAQLAAAERFQRSGEVRFEMLTDFWLYCGELKQRIQNEECRAKRSSK